MIGHIDEPLNNSTQPPGNLSCSGWVYSSAGIKKITIFIDGIEAGNAMYGIIRNDVTPYYPDYPDIEKSGFSFLMKKSIKKGVHRLRVQVFEGEGQDGADLGEIIFHIPENNILLNAISRARNAFSPKTEKISPQVEKRRRVAGFYLSGDGIEIGALHNPLPLSKSVRVRYVDRVPLHELKAQFSDVNPDSILPIDIIDNGETLEKIDNNSLNFIIANHFLEHCENPIGTIRNHLLKVKKGGILFYAIPEKNFTFDIDRPLTPFQHHIDDDVNGPSISRKSHMKEWITIIEKNQLLSEEELEKRTRDLVTMNYSIHFHVWNIDTIFEFFYKIQEYLNNSFRVLYFEQNYNEVIVVLQKT